MSRPTVQIVTLVEDTARDRDLLAEHGLAFWIDAGSKDILFDTGQGGVLLNNAQRLDVYLKAVDAVVLSHGHYDHTGGLDAILNVVPQVKVYAHPAAFLPKYGRNKDKTCRHTGIPSLNEQEIRRKADDVISTQGPTEICDGLIVTGQIPRRTDFEDTGGPFFTDKQCKEPDSLPDDQALFFETSQGTVVVLGCAHAGVVNTLRYIRELTGNKPIRAVIGGMHLLTASPQRLQATADAFEQYNIQLIAPAHCTGTKATAYFWSRFADRCVECTTGSRFVFE